MTIPHLPTVTAGTVSVDLAPCPLAWPEWCPPRGTPVTIEHDGFSGKVIGWYETLEGKPGVTLQLDNARVVHVYGLKWIKGSAP